jgi:uncharacterized protein (DUF983 family)
MIQNEYEDMYYEEDEEAYVEMSFTKGRIDECPYCGSHSISTYIDGTAECDECGREFRYEYM